jgi:thiol:disulfide interchange protein DsbD
VDPVGWRDDYEAALAEAKQSGKPVFLDFTGVLCINCREFEAAVFDKPDFIAAMDDFIPVRLYTDRRGEYRAGDEENQRIMGEVYGTGTLPFYVVLSPDGDELRRSGYDRRLLDVQEFLAFLYGDER